jgi:hypothetical protein
MLSSWSRVRTRNASLSTSSRCVSESLSHHQFTYKCCDACQNVSMSPLTAESLTATSFINPRKLFNFNIPDSTVGRRRNRICRMVEMMIHQAPSCWTMLVEPEQVQGALGIRWCSRSREVLDLHSRYQAAPIVILYPISTHNLKSTRR